MDLSRRRFGVIPAIALIVAVVPLAAIAAPPPPPGGHAILFSLDALSLAGQERAAHAPFARGARYDVHIHGGTAVGTVALEYLNDTDGDLRARLRSTLPVGLELTAMLRDTGGAIETLQAELTGGEPDGAAQVGPVTTRFRLSDGSPLELSAEQARLLDRHLRDKRGGIARATPDKPATRPAEFSSEPFDLPAGERLELHTAFRCRLDVHGHRLRLVLPALIEQLADELRYSPREPLPLKIVVTVHRRTPLVAVSSRSHAILADFEGDRTIVEPVQATVAPDRPFVLDLTLQPDDQPNLVSRVRAGRNGLRQVETLVNPPRTIDEAHARPKEVLFIIDTSGSMQADDKLAQARRAAVACLRKLRPVDRFNLVEFNDGFSWMRARPSDPALVSPKEAARWLDALQAGGGTKLLPALASAMQQPRDPQRHRILIAVTDGILQDEKETLALLDDKLGDARLFVVGTGPRLRQETLLRLAERGRGAATFAGTPRELESAVAELFASVSDPLGWDLEFDWGGADVTEVTPSRLPDLYAGRPVRVLAWVRGELPATLGVRMATMEGKRMYSVTLPPGAP